MWRFQKAATEMSVSACAIQPSPSFFPFQATGFFWMSFFIPQTSVVLTSTSSTNLPRNLPSRERENISYQTGPSRKIIDLKVPWYSGIWWWCDRFQEGKIFHNFHNHWSIWLCWPSRLCRASSSCDAKAALKRLNDCASRSSLVGGKLWKKRWVGWLMLLLCVYLLRGFFGSFCCWMLG